MSREWTFEDWCGFGAFSFVGLIVCAIVIVCILNVTGCQSDYSTGERTGTVIKFSEKGAIFKSWEGTLQLSGRGSADGGLYVWDFNVRSPAAREEIQKALVSGDHVLVKYNEWLISPCTQNSDHTVYDVVRQDK